MTDISWNKYGLISNIVTGVHTKPLQFGKTSLEKLIYFLQEAYGVDCGYTFELYTYGPFSSDILIDLDQVDALGGVSVESVPIGTGGYRIDPGSKNESVQKNATEFLTQHSVLINKMIDEFGGFSAKELELRSTIHYVFKEENGNITIEKLIKTVKEIKPKFSEDEISSAIKELIEKELIVFN